MPDHLKERDCVVCGNTFTYEARRGTPPVTCSPECKKARKTQTNLAWRKTAVIPDHLHGTVQGYVTYGCGCERCRGAHAAYHRNYEQRTKAD